MAGLVVITGISNLRVSCLNQISSMCVGSVEHVLPVPGGFSTTVQNMTCGPIDIPQIFKLPIVL